MTTPTNPVTAPVTPDRQRRVKGALTRYSVLAYITGVMLLVLTIEVLLNWVVFPITNTETPAWFWIIGAIHGWIFLFYALACLDLGIKARWAPAKWVTTILAGVIPVLSFILEKRRRSEVIEAFNLQ